MRKFADINVKVPIGKYDLQDRMATLACEIGLSMVCLRFTSKTPSIEVESSTKIFRNAGLEVAVGIDLSPNSRKQLLNQLRTFRRGFDIVAVKSADTRTMAVATHDSRVDLISLELQRSFRTKLSILKASKSNLELELARIIRPGCPVTYESLKPLCGEIELARRCRSDVVISSGATNPLTLRAPRDMISLTSSLGATSQFSLKSVSDIPFETVRKNLAMHSREVVE